MRIKSVECDQFAGLNGKEISFEEGLNLVVGKNESGKSTLVDLIYHMLFKDAKLDGRRDSDFIDKYFPRKVNGPDGDVVDGVIVFETPAGTYKLKKEWEKGAGTCRLIMPDGTSIKGIETINEVLTGELKHRAGVYGEIVFPSQRRNQTAVESIMRALEKKNDALSDIREDLTSTLTRAALETGGVSLDKIEKAIGKNMDELIGRWDWEADAPEGGAKRASFRKAWSSGVGTIVKAYYEADEVRSKQAESEKAEREVDAAKARIRTLQTEKKEAETEWTSFQRFKGMLELLTHLTTVIDDLEEKIRERERALEKWPRLGADIARARELQQNQQQVRDKKLYMKAAEIHRACQEKEAELQKLTEVDEGDLKSLRELIFRKQQEEGKLAGMNLAAKIRKLGDADINITSAASGEALELSEEEIRITEAVNISIPGIMDMHLMPQGVDVDEVKASIGGFEKKIGEIYGRYNVGSLDELQSMSEVYAGTKQEEERLRLNMENILGDSSWEEIKAAGERASATVETDDEINGQIADLCGAKTTETFIVGLETILSGYEEKYGSPQELGASVEKMKDEKEAKEEKLKSMDDIPEKFRGIDDPDRYDEECRRRIEDYEDRISDQGEKLREAERSLGDKSAEEYYDELQAREEALEGLKAEYAHWRNIYDVFCRLKEDVGGNPVEDIEDKFRDYLSAVTEGSLQLNSMDEQMSVRLSSGTNALTYDILSAGTKDAVSLAFRLAMLEHLFPEGGGLAVFDDPFTDMDTERVEQSCKLIRKFAENNQVIFVTCDPKYSDYMPGNTIEL